MPPPPMLPGQRDPAVDALIAQRVAPGKQVLVQAARAWVWQHLPLVGEGIRWGVVYFAHHGPLLYLDASLRYPGIRLGWARGHELQGPPHLLLAHGADALKVVRHTDLTQPEQLNTEALLHLLHQAAQLNELGSVALPHRTPATRSPRRRD